jgi:hypothetical protein
MVRDRTLDPSSQACGLLALARQTLVIATHPVVNPSPLLLCDGLLEWVDRRRWWLWGFMLLMYIAGFNGQWRMQPDAALYLSLGRNLAEGKGYTYLGQPHHLAYPGWPFLIAVAFKVFGSHALIAVNAMSTLIALLTVATVYRLFLLHTSRATAVAISTGVGLTKAFYCYGFELWADMPFALGALAFLTGYEGIITRAGKAFTPVERFRRRLIDALFLSGGLVLALATRPTVWPLLLAMAFALPLDAARGRIQWRNVVLIFTFAAAIACAILLGHHDFGSGYKQFLMIRLSGPGRHELIYSIADNTRSLLAWAASDVLFQVRLGPFFNALLSIVVLLLGFGLFRYRSLWGFWFCLLLGTILVSQETLDRYFLPVLPLLVFAWWNMIVRINRMLPARWGNPVFLLLLGFGTLMNFTKVCGIIAQQHSRPFLSSYDTGRYDNIPEFSQRLSAAIEPDAIVLMGKPYGRVCAFLSRRNVESAAEVAPVTAGRHPVYVAYFDPGDPLTNQFLQQAGLKEGPALFTVHALARCAAGGKTLSLHSTHFKRP